jgi:hypothetical protein
MKITADMSSQTHTDTVPGIINGAGSLETRWDPPSHYQLNGFKQPG